MKLSQYLPVFKYHLTDAKARINSLEVYASVLEQYVDRRVVITDGKVIEDHAMNAELLVLSGENIFFNGLYLETPPGPTKIVFKDCKKLVFSNSTHISRGAEQKLIHAAPELLRLIKNVMQWMESLDIADHYQGGYELLGNMAAAITKAEGEK